MDGQTGVLVPEGKIGELTETAVNLLNSPTRCRDLGHTAFSMGRRRFTVERMVADYVALYGKIT